MFEGVELIITQLVKSKYSICGLSAFLALPHCIVTLIKTHISRFDSSGYCSLEA